MTPPLVLFAASHPGHFSVMFRPNVYRAVDAQLVAARGRTNAVLRDGARARFGTTDRIRALTAWSLVHGLATLVRDGAVAPEPGTDLESLTRAVTHALTPTPAS
ncbi:TetR-like C-terminal domain-containing protein [Modestobacter excelsi]|uniref:TetR-like C-terminal domain-containing protein n=1 Tax=Modestobacter excelsi TaxID=2213161 RepID=UPI001C20EE72|nr:TetR-like C-terminal domain-containing protein [Modestobacter excelsi]